MPRISAKTPSAILTLGERCFIAIETLGTPRHEEKGVPQEEPENTAAPGRECMMIFICTLDPAF